VSVVVERVCGMEFMRAEAEDWRGTLFLTHWKDKSGRTAGKSLTQGANCFGKQQTDRAFFSLTLIVRIHQGFYDDAIPFLSLVISKLACN
jgi:hypothetical protein